MSKYENCVVIGLTGQSGAGKTTVSKVFEQNGFGVINCDMIARRITEDGSVCNRRLALIFPNCFDQDYKLDRRAIAEEVFSDKEKLIKFNGIIHPYICELINSEISRLSGACKYILLDAPTLFEAGADKMCDVIVSVVADSNIRLNRIIARDNIDKELAEKRMASQHTEAFFRDQSDYVISNNGGLSETKMSAQNTVDLIKGLFDG